ncbi:hypothetical protein GQX73_g5137 [Xylaria multiplex]|uniref:non-specific serine/threonine protein kinase n=1 Tax=Xylaria multiplex TaxID=323545 RepID=A0A7C8J140_9PEZI|nr:hypothetical protein GQX73_g5137 [Xylaria multiplex]
MDRSTATIQVDTLGLTLLYPRTDKAGLQAPPVMNIVFVHGLRGHPQGTWEYPAPVRQHVAAIAGGRAFMNKNNLARKLKLKFLKPPIPTLQAADRFGVVGGSKTVYWPADLLPSAVPRARIWTYGYNADISSGFFRPNNKNSILEHGNDLMVKVERALRDELPIVFVAHSVGGLVVKTAINDMHSSIDVRYQRLSHRIWAVVFCGSPHRGSDAAAWGKLATNLIAVALMDSNSRLFSDLQVDSRVLSRIQADFLKALWRAPLRIHSFQEGRALTGVKGLDSKVVDDFSSKLGWAPETFETIDADHLEMVKEPGVKDISDILKDLEQEAVVAAQALNISKQVENQESRGFAEELAKKADSRKLLQKLYASPYEDRKDRNPERVDGTCQWFTSHQLFQAWQRSETSNLLWVSADPGCGKSVLAKYLADDFLSGTNRRITCYFFFKDDFEDQRLPASALCCILRQVFIQRPALMSDEILERFQRDGKRLLDSFRGLWEILISVASNYDGEIVCILDALDECEEKEQSQIAKAVCRLCEAKKNISNLKFLLTSRPYIHIQREFRILENRLPTIHLSGENEVETEKISKEIDIVIRKNVEDLGTRLQLQPKERDLLQHELTRNPNRTYLWVYLMFDVINGSIGLTKGSLRTVVHSIPETVDVAYDRILCRSRDREKAMRLLHLVVVAARPLSLHEMALALAIKKSHRSYADLELEPESRFRQTVRELCGLFVNIIDSKIYLIHQTAKEFLVQKELVNETPVSGLNTNRLLWKSSLRPVESHRIMAEICIWHLLFDEFKSSSYPLTWREARQYSCDYIFAEYSITRWVAHYRKAHIDIDSPIQHSMLRLFDVERARVWFDFNIEARATVWDGYPRGFDALILASYFGFEGVGKLLLERGAKIEVEDEDGQTPLWWAVQKGYKSVVRLLIESGADAKVKDKDGWSVLHLAVENVDGEVVQLLLKNGADVQVKSRSNERTALHVAAKNGREAAVRLLLESGSETEAQSRDTKWTALHLAAMNGHKVIVRILLENGAGTEVKDKDGRTPLWWAVQNGHDAVVRLLFGHGAKAKVRSTNSCWTALHVAAMNGDQAIVQLLLENGADSEAKARFTGYTALHMAARNGHEIVVQLLLENEADAGAKSEDVQGYTALHLAVIKGYEAVIQALLKYSCLINERDGMGNTALHQAAQLKTPSKMLTIMTMLLEGGADIDMMNDDGKTVLDRLGTMREIQDLCLDLLSALRNLAAIQELPSTSGVGNLRQDLLKLTSAVASNHVHSDRIKPLLHAVLVRRPDVEIWEQVYRAVTESTPRKLISSILQTPWRLTTSTIVNSSEKRDQMDKALSDELGVMYIDIPDFYEAFFGNIPELETTSQDIFHKCTQGTQPLFQQGWTGWPVDAKQETVLAWLADIVERFLQWAQEYRPTTMRRPLAQPDTPLKGSVAKRKLDVGLVDDPKADKAGKYHWSHILVPGELKSNPNDDTPSKAHLDVARYVKEVFTAQPTRRFVLAFTLCGSWMRLWEFDRLGGIASDRFDINKDGQRFLSTILGFLWMDDEALGFDPTIIKKAHSIVGRATVCWKAYLEGDKSKPFVIKDSWQFPERDEEGELLQQATRQEVTNVARHYYHETVRIQTKDDDIRDNVRKGLDITKASNYRTGRSRNLGPLTVEAISRNSSAGSKRSSSQTGALLPPGKRSHSGSASPTKHDNEPLPNRIHRRIVLCDWGEPIYKGSSRAALLRALEGCIQGHESLYKKAGLLHRDISINNLIINEDINKSSFSSFLIDLDLAVEVNRTEASGAKEITGTRAFMAIGVLMGEGHSYMDDLESFFWVLFWTCVHYDGNGHDRETDFTKWNEVDTMTLAGLKKAVIDDEKDFIYTANEYFTDYYKPLIPWVDKLRRVVFPNGRRWQQADETLYSQMRQILNNAQNDPQV